MTEKINNNEIKIIHTGDLHLGMTFKSLGKKSKLHRRDCQDVFSNIIHLCIKEKVNGLLIAGDLFDEPNPSKSIITFVIDELKKLKEKNIPVFLISGNHDPYKKNSFWFNHKFPSNVIIFENNSLEPKTVGNLTVYGLAYIDNTKEPLKDFKAKSSNDFKIGLIHGSTINIKVKEEPESSYRPIKKAQIDSSNLDYIALGHFHDLLEVKAKTKCFYCGSPEGLSFKNNLDSGILLVKYSKKKVIVKPIKTSIRGFHTINVDCTKFDNDSEIRKILEKNKGDNKILRLVLKGSPSLDFQLDVDLFMKEFESEYFFLKIVDKVHIPDNLTEDETIRGQFIKLIKSEIEKEKNPKKKKIFENALRIGIGHLDKKL
ncbi:DNA repair exonuclease [Candidatus Woesearchaeota archaeon]|nr:DNA repair exonuclease [archaeon]MBT4630932.1 DNA repair exonuclease [Candidatus Woesearchaeota archaeon]